MSDSLKGLYLYAECFNHQSEVDAPSVYDHMYFYDENKINEVIQYLENGFVLFEFVSPIRDVIDSADLIPNKIYTDGSYTWNAVLIHWLRKYRVKLPEELLSHIDKQILFGNQMSSLEGKDFKEALRKCCHEGVRVLLD